MIVLKYYFLSLPKAGCMLQVLADIRLITSSVFATQQSLRFPRSGTHLKAYFLVNEATHMVFKNVAEILTVALMRLPPARGPAIWR